ncbi:cysteine-rich venom protein 6-like isoform X4 [Dinothrombium tinctorium]|uniref:Cysteine-rich venom protein 6-like isoform X4 n=1 Tax=Dinothrombium tinctorium TaxID=1965070 RepID=A0A443Q7K3_9ACAR|nr:cysteine-rich venom protein 6-like isoform X4 [Dinothrombium tinctorium]
MIKAFFILVTIACCCLIYSEAYYNGIFSELTLNLIISIFFLVREASDASQCRLDEYFVTCGSACEDTCANINIRPRICTLQCLIGCQCRGDLVRNANGECVNRNQC